MINVAVVDAGAKSLCAALNGISSREKRGITFSAKETIEQLFPDLETTAFDLILLHHHWEGPPSHRSSKESAAPKTHESLFSPARA